MANKSNSSTGQGIARPLPAINQDTQFYWQGGEQNKLLIFQCQDCEYYVHPPVRFCPKCESQKVEPEAVSGEGVITSFTINHKQWMPELQVPYVVALVSIVEQKDVRLVCNIVNCDVDDVSMGMPVTVLFEQNENLWIPLFEPKQGKRSNGDVEPEGKL